MTLVADSGPPAFDDETDAKSSFTVNFAAAGTPQLVVVRRWISWDDGKTWEPWPDPPPGGGHT